jgi:hypothetical protein
MAVRRYDWKRFWYPRDGDVYVTDEGFLRDPESDWGRFENTDVVALSSLLDKPCLVLLGEAGIGKSTELKSLGSGTGGDGSGQALRLDLAQYGDEAALRSDLFESPLFRDWRSGDDLLTVVLDSLDEAMLGMPRIACALERGLRGAPVDRLRLRIACRTAGWPEGLTDFLEEKFSKQHVRLYELAPLRRQDIEKAASVEGLDARAFLEELRQRGAGPLAASPTTLRFLLGLYSEQQNLTASLVKLYERGLAVLCERSNERRERNKPADLSARQILQVAGRVAALMIFTRRAAIFTGLSSDALPSDLAESAAVGGEEQVDGMRFAVTPAVVELVLNETGLFTSRGPRRFGFAHKTYGEYLAAWYLYRAGVPKAQIRSLLYLPDEDTPRLIPQLQEVAAWLASFEPSLFDEIAETEPEVLLLSDVSARLPEAKSRLVTKLLERVDRAELSRAEVWNLRCHYLKRLAYDGLTAQLRAVLQDDQRRWETRELAIEMADATGQGEFAEDIADIALDSSLEQALRVTAARVVVNLGVESACRSLKPLALGAAGDDPDDELRGCGLRASWPTFLTTRELLQSLTLPKRPNLVGAYDGFLHSAQIAEGISVADLPEALEWALDLPHGIHAPCSLSRLAGQLAYRALEHMDDAAVGRLLAKLVWRALKAGERGVFVPFREPECPGSADHEPDEVQIDERRRHELVRLLAAHADSPEAMACMLSSRLNLVQRGDIGWVFEQANASAGEESRKWSHLASWLFDPAKREHVELWLDYRWSCPAIAEQMAWSEQMALGSPEARTMKAKYIRGQRWRKQVEREREKGRQVEPPRVRIALRRCLGGEPELFWWLCKQLMIDPASGRPDRSVPETVYDHPGWTAADAAVRAQIVEAARRYLSCSALNAKELAGRSNQYVADRAPALAVHLLLQEDPLFLDSLESSYWESIGPYLLYAPVGNDETRRRAAEFAFSQAGGAMRAAAMEIIRRGRQAHEWNDVITAFEDRPDPPLACQVLSYLQEESCGPEQFRDLLGWLLRHRAEGAREFAESLLSGSRLTAEQWPRLCREAAIVLFNWADDAAWNVTWPLIEGQPAFGKEVLQDFAHDFRRLSLNVVKRLEEPQLGQLLHWLMKHYPPASDPDHQGAYFYGREDSLRQWRNTVLEHLRRRGTTAACDALRGLRDGHPECPWLHDVYLEAQRARRRESWMAPSPAEFLKLVQDGSRRFVASAGQLLDLIVESLERFDEELHGTTPSVANLWDHLPNGTWRPKDENHLSDNINRHLERDLCGRGVVVNREVEIRRRTSRDGVPGQVTDIHVTAVAGTGAADAGGNYTVIIEVKGCWHQKVKSAMDTQLVDRYLHENQCQHGLYVVGWFVCNAWDKSDSRKAGVPWGSLAEAADELKAQASVLCGSVRVRAYVADCALP